MEQKESIDCINVGYQIFQIHKSDKSSISGKRKFPYKLVGPGNQEFYLLRLNPRPHLLIAYDEKTESTETPFKEHLFSDEGGRLNIVRDDIDQA